MNRFLILAALSVAACSPKTEEVRQPRKVIRSETVDGVMLVSEADNTRHDNHFVRCWPKNGKQDCLFGSMLYGEKVSQLAVQRRLLDTLPTTLDAPKPSATEPRYKCEVAWQGIVMEPMWYVEQMILREFAALATQQSFSSSDYDFDELWDRSYVAKWGEDNRVPALVEQYVDCHAIGELIQQGSFDTLGTAMLTPTVLDGR